MNLVLDFLKKESLLFIQSDVFELSASKIDKSTQTTSYTSYKIKLSSEQLKRKIAVSLTDYYHQKRIFFNIHNTDGGSHTILPLDRYLEEYCNVKRAGDAMLIDQYSGDTIEQKIKSFFTHIKPQLNNRFFKILLGEDWVEIPTEWGDYK